MYLACQLYRHSVAKCPSVYTCLHVCTYSTYMYIYIYSADSMVLGSAVSLWLFLLGSRLSV